MTASGGERAGNPHPGTARADRPLLGILLLVGAVTFFSCLDATGKWINRTGDPMMTAAIRYAGNAALAAAILATVPPRRLPRSRAPGLQVGRGLLLALSTITSFVALQHLPLAQATAINFAAPLVVALLAGPLLGEWPGPHRLAAVGIGFAGVLVVTRPWAGPVQAAMLLALVTALANACYALATRMLAPRDAPLVTLFYGAAVGSAVFVPLLPGTWTTPGSAALWIALGLTGLFGTLGHGLMVLANRYAAASTLAPFFYAQILAATVLGWLVFGDLPDRWTVLGAAIVTASGLYILLRERRRGVAPTPEVVP